MKLKIYPYTFRTPATPATLKAYSPESAKASGARALYVLYSAGISFRLIPGAYFNAVIFMMDEASAALLRILDIPGIYAGKGKGLLPVFMALDREYPYSMFQKAHRMAFARLAMLAKAPGLEYRPPQMLIPGRPFTSKNDGSPAAVPDLSAKEPERKPPKESGPIFHAYESAEERRKAAAYARRISQQAANARSVRRRANLLLANKPVPGRQPRCAGMTEEQVRQAYKDGIISKPSYYRVLAGMRKAK